MSASSTRSDRLVRRAMSAASRRGLQFVRRASLGGLLAASVFAAGEASAQDQTGTAGDASGSSSFGAAPITMNGGTLTLNATRSANRLNERIFDGNYANAQINVLDPSNPASFFNI